MKSVLLFLCTLFIFSVWARLPSVAMPAVGAGDPSLEMGHMEGMLNEQAQSTCPEMENSAAGDQRKVEQAPAVPSSFAPIPASIMGPDDVEMHLIVTEKREIAERASPGGSTSFAEHALYMDETLVTNHQFVEFLNKMLEKVSVEDGIVKGDDGNIWFFLGEVKEGYEPVTYQNGRFTVKGVHHAACAVLRVTAYGASAYAKFYGKRLPTESEWMVAAASTKKADRQALPIPSPVLLYPRNEKGIRGLNSNIREWAVRMSGKKSHGGELKRDFVVMGGLVVEETKREGPTPGVRRYPWEAFSQVGFRCVSDVLRKDDGDELKSPL